MKDTDEMDEAPLHKRIIRHRGDQKTSRPSDQ